MCYFAATGGRGYLRSDLLLLDELLHGQLMPLDDLASVDLIRSVSPEFLAPLRASLCLRHATLIYLLGLLSII